MQRGARCDYNWCCPPLVCYGGVCFLSLKYLLLFALVYTWLTLLNQLDLCKSSIGLRLLGGRFTGGLVD